MCIVLKGQDLVVQQACCQLEDLVPVWAVFYYTRNKAIEQELLLVKVSILGPKEFQEQMHTNSKAKDFSKGFFNDHSTPDYSTHNHLLPLEALSQKHFHLQTLKSLASRFSAKVIDVSHHLVIIELSPKTTCIDAFLKLFRPYGILEATQTGVMVMPQAPIESNWQGMSDLEDEDNVNALHVGLLPPG
ncbi:hypothetical protein BY996DRAFT_8531414 [Phakopsora pachyrhizi]|nr:hypothetical protein BY996DRAFT_8531414 [Phakopsora pachyrhizi]